MIFSVLVVAAFMTITVSASPLAIRRIQARDCDYSECALALGSTGITCLSAAAKLGKDRFADAKCVVAVLSRLTDIPPPCEGCASGVLDSVTDAVGGAVDRVEDTVGNAFHDVFGKK